MPITETDFSEELLAAQKIVDVDTQCFTSPESDKLSQDKTDILLDKIKNLREELSEKNKPDPETLLRLTYPERFALEADLVLKCQAATCIEYTALVICLLAVNKQNHQEIDAVFQAQFSSENLGKIKAGHVLPVIIPKSELQQPESLLKIYESGSLENKYPNAIVIDVIAKKSYKLSEVKDNVNLEYGKDYKPPYREHKNQYIRYDQTRDNISLYRLCYLSQVYEACQKRGIVEKLENYLNQAKLDLTAKKDAHKGGRIIGGSMIGFGGAGIGLGLFGQYGASSSLPVVAKLACPIKLLLAKIVLAKTFASAATITVTLGTVGVALAVAVILVGLIILARAIHKNRKNSNLNTDESARENMSENKIDRSTIMNPQNGPKT